MILIFQKGISSEFKKENMKVDDNANLENSEMADETIKQDEHLMVEDQICNNFIDRRKAYIIVRNGKEHYFCSWQCRQKFILQNSHHVIS
jgi:YHS domain-containing protein